MVRHDTILARCLAAVLTASLAISPALAGVAQPDCACCEAHFASSGEPDAVALLSASSLASCCGGDRATLPDRHSDEPTSEPAGCQCEGICPCAKVSPAAVVASASYVAQPADVARIRPLSEPRRTAVAAFAIFHPPRV